MQINFTKNSEILELVRIWNHFNKTFGVELYLTSESVKTQKFRNNSQRRKEGEGGATSSGYNYFLFVLFLLISDIQVNSTGSQGSTSKREGIQQRLQARLSSIQHF